jgi:hypothetical protein
MCAATSQRVPAGEGGGRHGAAYLPGEDRLIAGCVGSSGLCARNWGSPGQRASRAIASTCCNGFASSSKAIET